MADPCRLPRIASQGGTILGTVNKGNFAIKVGVDQKGAIEPAVLEKTKATVRRLDWIDPDRWWAETAPSPRLFCFPR